MKTKLTLWLEKSTIRFGKRYAAQHGTSLSHLVEHILMAMVRAEGAADRCDWWEEYDTAHPVGGPSQCELAARLS